jgi:hypothetical protein
MINWDVRAVAQLQVRFTVDGARFNVRIPPLIGTRQQDQIGWNHLAIAHYDQVARADILPKDRLKGNGNFISSKPNLEIVPVIETGVPLRGLRASPLRFMVRCICSSQNHTWMIVRRVVTAVTLDIGVGFLQK